MVSDEFYKAYKSVDNNSMRFLFYYTSFKKECEQNGEFITQREKEAIAKKFLPYCHFSV